MEKLMDENKEYREVVADPTLELKKVLPNKPKYNPKYNP